MCFADWLWSFFRRPAPAPPANPGSQGTLIAAVHAARLQAGAAPLVVRPDLCSVAAGHARQMQVTQRLGHDGIGDGDLASRLSGLAYQSAGEVIALNGGGAEAVVVGWLHSPPHRAILLGDWTAFGAGRAVDYWCAVFVR